MLQANAPSPVTITVQSESCLLLGASRRALVQLMGHGPAVMGLSADDAALASSALMSTAALQDLNDTEIKSLVASFELREYSEGMVLAWAGEAADSMYIIKSGECLLTSAISSAQRQALQDASPQGGAKREIRSRDPPWGAGPTWGSPKNYNFSCPQRWHAGQSSSLIGCCWLQARFQNHEQIGLDCRACKLPCMQLGQTKLSIAGDAAHEQVAIKLMHTCICLLMLSCRKS